MMAALNHRIALLLNQSGKVPSLKAGESRGTNYRIALLSKKRIDRPKGMARWVDSSSRHTVCPAAAENGSSKQVLLPAGGCCVWSPRQTTDTNTPIKSRFIRHNFGFHRCASGKGSPHHPSRESRVPRFSSAGGRRLRVLPIRMSRCPECRRRPCHWQQWAP